MLKNACIICLSPYRKEIVSLHNQGVDSKRIWTSYAVKMNYSAGPKAFYMILRRHLENKHNFDAILIPTEKTGGVTPATIENFGKRMLELGMAKIENVDPSQVKLSDVIQAQKLVLESKKLKLNEESMLLMMGKLFGPKLETKDAIEGEYAA